MRRLVLLTVVTIVACSKPPREERKRPAVAAAPAAEPVAAKVEAKVEAKEVLGFEDFTRVLGVTPGAKEAAVKAALGEPEEREEREGGDVVLRYGMALSIYLRASGGIQINLNEDAPKRLGARHPADPALSLLGRTCEDASRRAPFMGAIERYRSCKHYTEDLFTDVTVMCGEKVSKVSVVWEPLPPTIKAEPRPPDHCN